MRDTRIVVCRSMDGAGIIAPPSAIQLIPSGHVNTPKGDFLMDDEAAAMVMAAFAGRKNDVVIDYEHQTLAGVEAPAAGWITGLENRGPDGIWANVEWTDRAKAYIAAREYRFISPVFVRRGRDGRVTELLSAGLTNAPNIDGMEPLANKRAGNSMQEEEHGMKELYTLLGLPDGAPEATVVEKVGGIIAARDTAVTAHKKMIAAIGLPENANDAEVSGTIMAMKQSHEAGGNLAMEVTSLKDRLAARDAAELVAMAMKDGKITPAQKEWAEGYARTDAEGFRVFIAKAAVVVPMGTIAGPDGAATGAIDAAQSAINSMMGITAEMFRKHNPKTEGGM